MQIEADDKDIVDEEEMLCFKEMKDAKKQYRDAYEERKALQSEVDYLSRIVDNSRLQLFNQFEEWFSSKYDSTASPKSVAPPVEKKSVPETSSADEDKLDDGEKFDKLEMERIQRQDPDAYAYFRAMKKMEQNRSLLKTKPKKK